MQRVHHRRKQRVPPVAEQRRVRAQGSVLVDDARERREARHMLKKVQHRIGVRRVVAAKVADKVGRESELPEGLDLIEEPPQRGGISDGHRDGEHVDTKVVGEVERKGPRAHGRLAEHSDALELGVVDAVDPHATELAIDGQTMEALELVRRKRRLARGMQAVPKQCRQVFFAVGGLEARAPGGQSGRRGVVLLGELLEH
eukprot:Amastigsp_a353556_6.p2 type:complete len:200 gc:universal Amastigsp_a353556_6:489-1088(+)